MLTELLIRIRKKNKSLTFPSLHQTWWKVCYKHSSRKMFPWNILSIKNLAMEKHWETHSIFWKFDFVEKNISIKSEDLDLFIFPDITFSLCELFFEERSVFKHSVHSLVMWWESIKNMLMKFSAYPNEVVYLNSQQEHNIHLTWTFPFS